MQFISLFHESIFYFKLLFSWSTLPCIMKNWSISITTHSTVHILTHLPSRSYVPSHPAAYVVLFSPWYYYEPLCTILYMLYIHYCGERRWWWWLIKISFICLDNGSHFIRMSFVLFPALGGRYNICDADAEKKGIKWE